MSTMKPKPTGWVMHWKGERDRCYVYISMADGLLCYESAAAAGGRPKFMTFEGGINNFVNDKRAHLPTPDCQTIVKNT